MTKYNKSMEYVLRNLMTKDSEAESHNSLIIML